MKSFFSLFACAAVILFAGCSSSGGQPDPSQPQSGSTASPDGGTATGGDGGAQGGVSAACARYLACLQVASPQDYGAAVQQYGAGSACAAGSCDSACAASFDRIENSCQCSGATCTACTVPKDGVYQAAARFMCTENGGTPFAYAIVSVTVTVGAARSGTLKISWEGSDLTLTGTLACGAPAPLTGSAAAVTPGCTNVITGTLTAASDTSISLAVKQDGTCNNGVRDVCTLDPTMFSLH
jgi:hypothetical protein